MELRKDDRGYEVGDILCLHEWDPESQAYTNDKRAVEVVVTHIVRGGQFGLAEGHVALSVKSRRRKLNGDFNKNLVTLAVMVVVFAVMCFLYLRTDLHMTPSPCNCVCEKKALP